MNRKITFSPSGMASTNNFHEETNMPHEVRTELGASTSTLIDQL